MSDETGKKSGRPKREHPGLEEPCGPTCIRHRLVTLDELAVHTRLPLKWLRRLLRSGQLPCLRAGNRVLFALEHVEKEVLSLARKNRFGQWR